MRKIMWLLAVPLLAACDPPPPQICDDFREMKLYFHGGILPWSGGSAIRTVCVIEERKLPRPLQ